MMNEMKLLQQKLFAKELKQVDGTKKGMLVFKFRQTELYISKHDLIAQKGVLRMTTIKCSETCKWNKDGICQAEEIEMGMDDIYNYCSTYFEK